MGFLPDSQADIDLEISVGLARRAFKIKNRFQIGYWDTAILAAARENGCHTFFCEDFNHGQVYDSVQVLNPFL